LVAQRHALTRFRTNPPLLPDNPDSGGALFPYRLPSLVKVSRFSVLFRSRRRRRSHQIMPGLVSIQKAGKVEDERRIFYHEGAQRYTKSEIFSSFPAFVRLLRLCGKFL
jgi:hypothetical protein